MMSIKMQTIAEEEVIRLIDADEDQFLDMKSVDVAPAQLTKLISAFANSDGGELYVGLAESRGDNQYIWNGFVNQEAANGHLQVFEKLFPLGTNFQYEFLKSDQRNGIVLHVQINKTNNVVVASNGLPYVRRGAQSLPVDSPEARKRLEYAKGVASFEDEITNADSSIIIESDISNEVIREISPSSTIERWLKKQSLLRGDRPTVAGLLIFSDEPQAQLPKRCGIKVYRYKTSEAEGFREALAFDPETVEGPIYVQISEAVKCVTRHVEAIQKMGEKGLESITYPKETIHEIISNSVLHRDYSIADDVHIKIFDNRIEIQSPGRLPGHVTVDNILDERYARNGAIVRILNKFPNPPNKDIGEGLNTAFNAMQQLGLKVPIIKEKENAVVITIKHEPLASPEEAIMDFLEKNESIKNKEARDITHIRADYQMKRIFGRMIAAGMIEQVPGTFRASTAYRKKSSSSGDC